jgi:hypothetical protein
MQDALCAAKRAHEATLALEEALSQLAQAHKPCREAALWVYADVHPLLDKRLQEEKRLLLAPVADLEKKEAAAAKRRQKEKERRRRKAQEAKAPAPATTCSESLAPGPEPLLQLSQESEAVAPLAKRTRRTVS